MIFIYLLVLNPQQLHQQRAFVHRSSSVRSEQGQKHTNAAKCKSQTFFHSIYNTTYICKCISDSIHTVISDTGINVHRK